jgi:hypothetical protein
VCGERICRNLLHEAVRVLPEDLQQACAFLLRGVVPEPQDRNGASPSP